MKWFPLPFGRTAVMMTAAEAADVQSGLAKLRRFEAMQEAPAASEHEHRAVLDEGDFGLLVSGAEVTPHCRCRSYVRLILKDIGYDRMLSIIGVAQAAGERPGYSDTWAGSDDGWDG